MIDELGDDLVHLDGLDVTWGFDMDVVLQERAQQVPAGGDAGDGTAETIGPSQGSAVDASSALAGRVETAETIGSSQKGAVDAFSVPVGRTENDPSAASTPDTDQGNGGDLPCRRGQLSFPVTVATLSTRAVPVADPKAW